MGGVRQMDSSAVRERLVAQLMTDGGALDTLKVSVVSRVRSPSPMPLFSLQVPQFSIPVCRKPCGRRFCRPFVCLLVQSQTAEHLGPAIKL